MKTHIPPAYVQPRRGPEQSWPDDPYRRMDAAIAALRDNPPARAVRLALEILENEE